tara:strand:+ start:99 stop:323 length:225 start_codon:yes stop_codon:yes gene_type:complete
VLLLDGHGDLILMLLKQQLQTTFIIFMVPREKKILTNDMLYNIIQEHKNGVHHQQPLDTLKLLRHLQILKQLQR